MRSYTAVDDAIVEAILARAKQEILADNAFGIDRRAVHNAQHQCLVALGEA